MVRYHHHIRHDPRIYASTSPVQKTGVEPDHLYNLVLWLIPVCILCARAYYVLFEWEQYKDNLLSVFQINKGGLAIYGGILGGVAVVLIYCKVKKLSFWSLADTLIPSLVLGQAIGRWGEFCESEGLRKSDHKSRSPILSVWCLHRGTRAVASGDVLLRICTEYTAADCHADLLSAFQKKGISASVLHDRL